MCPLNSAIGHNLSVWIQYSMRRYFILARYEGDKVIFAVWWVANRFCKLTNSAWNRTAVSWWKLLIIECGKWWLPSEQYRFQDLPLRASFNSNCYPWIFGKLNTFQSRLRLQWTQWTIKRKDIGNLIKINLYLLLVYAKVLLSVINLMANKQIRKRLSHCFFFFLIWEIQNVLFFAHQIAIPICYVRLCLWLNLFVAMNLSSFDLCLDVNTKD